MLYVTKPLISGDAFIFIVFPVHSFIKTSRPEKTDLLVLLFYFTCLFVSHLARNKEYLSLPPYPALYLFVYRVEISRKISFLVKKVDLLSAFS